MCVFSCSSAVDLVLGAAAQRSWVCVGREPGRFGCVSGEVGRQKERALTNQNLT